MEELELLHKHRRGDPTAFATLVKLLQGPLLRYVTTLTQDPDRAQDAVQEAFLSLVHTNGTLPDNPRAWLFRVARNRAQDSTKKEARMRTREKRAAVPELTPPVPFPVEQREQNDALQRSFGALPTEIREVLTLKIHEGMSYRQIAEVTGLSLSKVSQLIHRGLKRLASGLRAAGVV